MLNSLSRARRRGFTLAELIVSFAVAAATITIVSQLIVTSRTIVARNSLRQRANEEILNVVEQVSVLPYEMLDGQTEWDTLLVRSNDAALSRWNLSLDVSVVENSPGANLQSKRILVRLEQGARQNPIRIQTVTWRFSNDLK